MPQAQHHHPITDAETGTDSDSDSDTDRRLTDLEVKASYSDDLLEHLNLQVARQQQQIDRLVQELAELKRRQPDDSGGAPFRSLRDELPPHY